MKPTVKIARLFLAAFMVTALGACSSLQKKPEYAGTDDGDFVTGSPLPERQEGSSFLGSSTDRNQFSPIYFGFDSYNVSGAESSKLDRVAQFLQSSPGDLIIAGFTDERGTAEYNRGLGERRAQAVRSYLIEIGADASRIQTTSFGAEMPADPGSGEAAWAKNRRAEFGVVR